MLAKQETINQLRDLILKSEGAMRAFKIKGHSIKCHLLQTPACNFCYIDEGRILRALYENFKAPRIPIIDMYGKISYWNVKTDSFEPLCTWTLCLPANQQEEETLIKLIDILTSKL